MHLRAELDLARATDYVIPDPAGRCGRERRRRHVECWRVGEVCSIRSHFELHALGYGDALEQRQIHIERAGAAEEVASGVAEQAGGGDRELGAVSRAEIELELLFFDHLSHIARAAVAVLPQSTVADSLTSPCVQSHLCSICLRSELLKANSSVIS
jgi:hypothetical protein